MDFFVVFLHLEKPKASSSAKTATKVAPLSPKKQSVKKEIKPTDFFGSSSAKGSKKRSLEEAEVHDDEEFKTTLRNIDSSTKNVVVNASKAVKGQSFRFELEN